MLYLVRKLGESIIINDNIELKVVDVKGRSVKIGFDFPPSATVLRKEIHDRIAEENRSASSVDDVSDLPDLENFDLERISKVAKKLTLPQSS